MKLIVGLGNPGREYARTRHNIGYRVAEALVERWSLGGWTEKFHGLLADGSWEGQRVALLRPLTFMNVSGKSVLAAGRFYKIELPELLVVGDDLDLPPAALRVRASGSSGGQRGLEDVIARLGTKEFARLRIGIGRPARGDVVSFILGPFAASEERDWVEATIGRACEAVECWVRHGTTKAMNEFNKGERGKDI